MGPIVQLICHLDVEGNREVSRRPVGVTQSRQVTACDNTEVFPVVLVLQTQGGNPNRPERTAQGSGTEVWGPVIPQGPVLSPDLAEGHSGWAGTTVSCVRPGLGVFPYRPWDSEPSIAGVLCLVVKWPSCSRARAERGGGC